MEGYHGWRVLFFLGVEIETYQTCRSGPELRSRNLLKAGRPALPMFAPCRKVHHYWHAWGPAAFNRGDRHAC